MLPPLNIFFPGKLVFANVPEEIKSKNDIFGADDVFYLNDAELFSIDVTIDSKIFTVSCGPVVDTSFNSTDGTSLNGRSFFRISTKDQINIEEFLPLHNLEV